MSIDKKQLKLSIMTPFHFNPQCKKQTNQKPELYFNIPNNRMKIIGYSKNFTRLRPNILQLD